MHQRILARQCGIRTKVESKQKASTSCEHSKANQVLLVPTEWCGFARPDRIAATPNVHIEWAKAWLIE